MSKSTVNKARRAIAKADAIIAKATPTNTARIRKAKRAPGNAAALQQKAADNVGRIVRGRGKAEVIAIITPTQDGGHIYVEGSKGSSFTRPRNGDSKEFRSYAVKGALYDAAAAYNAANPAPKPQAQLANGVDARTAPHSAAAVRAQTKAAPKGKAGKTAALKAGKSKQPSTGANRSYTVGKTKNTAKADSWRGYMLSTIMGSKDTASAKAKHAKAGKFADKKLDFNWAAAQGYINWANHK